MGVSWALKTESVPVGRSASVKFFVTTFVWCEFACCGRQNLSTLWWRLLRDPLTMREVTYWCILSYNSNIVVKGLTCSPAFGIGLHECFPTSLDSSSLLESHRSCEALVFILCAGHWLSSLLVSHPSFLSPSSKLSESQCWLAMEFFGFTYSGLFCPALP